MEDTQVIEMLMEGGNAGYPGDDGETAGYAEKMNLTKISKSKLKAEIIEILKDINEAFEKEFHYKLWKKFDIVIGSGDGLNGSSKQLFDDTISHEKFAKAKENTVGDIDVMFPGEHMADLWKFLNDHEVETKNKFGNAIYKGHQYGSKAVAAGKFDKEKAGNLAQINGIFKLTVNEYTVNAQIDFVASDFKKDNTPTEWAKFSHSSDWEDVQRGFKGVNHKYAMTIVAHIISKDLPDSQIMHYLGLDKLPAVDKKTSLTVTETTGKKLALIPSSELPKENHGDTLEKELSNIYNKVTGKTMNNILKSTQDGVKVTASHFVSFSVGKGVRVKYKPALTKDGQPFVIDGKMVLIEIDPKNATYETNLDAIFKLFFGRDPSGTDIKDMGSFIGVIKLLKGMEIQNSKKYYDEFLDDLVKEKLWGHQPYYHERSQELERDSKAIDAKIKWSMVDYIVDELGIGDSDVVKKAKQMAVSYYETWKGKTNEDIGASFIPFGSKFSAIFESVSKVKKH